MSAEEWMALLALATAGSFTPGPNTTLSAALAAQGGLRNAWRFVCAVPLGWALMLAMCSTALGALLQQYVWLHQLLQWSCAAYLMLLAARLWASPTAQGPGALGPVGLGQGVLLQLLNGKAWILTFAVVGGWIAPSTQPAWRAAQVIPVLMAFALVSNAAYALLGATLGSRATVVRGLAVLLALSAVWMAVA